MDTLPKSNTLPIEPLTRIFQHTSATYKFFWFMGILDLYVHRDLRRMSIWDLMVEMTANAWYPVCHSHLSFGKVDSLHDAIVSLQRTYDISIHTSPDRLRSWLRNHNNDPQVRQTLDFLPKNVPYWFLRPWIDVADTKEIMRRSQSLENNCLYMLTKDNDTIWIELNSQWLPYITEHHTILKDFAYCHLADFLQVRNPHVPNITTKLVNPTTHTIHVRA